MKNKIKKFVVCTMCVILSVLILCSCAGESVDKLSDEEINELREIYPYDDFSIMSSLEFTLDAIDDKINTVAVVTVTDEWFIKTSSISPVEIPNERFPSEIEWPYLPVKVDSILYNNCEIEEGDELNLFFGSTNVFSNFDTYPVGERFLCLIIKPDETREYAFDDTVYTTTIDSSAYVTDDDYILSVTSEPALDDFTGYSLKSFDKSINEIMKKANK